MSANNSTDEMYVTKRDGESEIVSFDKILTRIKKIGKEANIKINYTSLVIKIIDQLYDKISTTKIDELMAEQCASMSSIHYDYGTLASRLIISNHHKNTSSTFSHVMNQLYNNRDKHDKHCPLISDELYQIISNPIHQDRIDSYIQHDRDYLFDYFGFKTLERSYLMRINRIVIERPQHMWMRVALAIHADNLEKAFETYDLMSQKYFTHATPTLFNAGTRHQQLSSCYLIAMEEDSIEGIYNTLKDCALISKWAGGIGLHIHNIRASNSQIRGTNGTSNGIVPMLRVFNNTAKYVDQCFASTTNIYTKNGAVSFYELTANDDVYNNTGTTEKIESILNYDKPGEVLNKIKIYDEEKTDFPSLLCTGEHPICILSATEDDTATIANDLKLGLKEFSWTPASELVVGDFIVNKIPDYLNDDESISVEMATLYGLLFARAEIPFSDPSNYYFADSGNLLLYADSNGTRFWSTYMSGVDYSFKTTWDGRPFLSIDKSLTDLTFFNMRNEKRIDSRYLYLSETKTRALIDAYFASTSAYNPDIQFLCLRLGDMRYFKENSCHVLRDTGFVLIPIQRIEQSSEFWNGQVHDLQMPSVHNYMTEFGLVHNGGGKRNGSIAVYLEPWHADIELFLEMRKNHGDEEMKARDLFYSLWIPDLFMKRVKEDAEWTLMCPDECPGLADVWGERFEELYQSYEKSGKGRKTMKARELWFKVLDAQMETGTPYLCYKDAANRKSNQQNLGTIKSSNLCVAPETLILTDKGHVEIQSLVGKTVNVWNGQEWSNVIVNKTGNDQEVMDVYTDDGSMLTCTPYHKFYIHNRHSRRNVEIKRANELTHGDKILKCKYPIIDGDGSMYNYKQTPPYHHGVFCGDNLNSRSYLKPSFALSSEIHDNIYIPSGGSSLKTKLEWFAGYCDANGEIIKNGEDEQFQALSIHYKFLMQIKYMLQTCGVNPSVKLYYEKHTPDLPINVFFTTSQIREHLAGTTEKCYRLMIDSYDLYQLCQLGFSPKTLKVSGAFPKIAHKNFVKIVKTEYNNRNCDTYCFNEPRRHMGIFNGILTGQCSEIMQYSDNMETAVCNLASIALPTFVNEETKQMDYEKLHEVAKVVTYNLNRVIDINFYPTEKTKRSNLRHRPIGIGVQGLADVFMKMDIAFHSEQAREVNRLIFETIYHGAVERSYEIARDLTNQYACNDGEYNMYPGAYETFIESPASQGLLQFDLWGVEPTAGRYDWKALKENIQNYGMRNSLLMAPMPTASTSQILGYNECFEPFTSNIYSRRTLAGEFVLTNKYLMRDLMDCGMWTERVKNNIIANQGSVQQLEGLSEHLKQKYKTVWEIPMRHVIDMAADRGAFICQSQSLNLWMEDPNYAALTSMHFHAWQKGLKTGIYYLRRRARHKAQQFTIEPEKMKRTYVQEDQQEGCTMCSA